MTPSRLRICNVIHDPALRPTHRGFGHAHGTFGELLQGSLPGPDNNFLVTLPVEQGSQAVFRLDPDVTSVSVLPERKTKSLALARRILEHFGVNHGGLLEIASKLPEGKGMASSSADLVATARAVADAVGRRLPVQDLLRMLRDIEPTDGVMYAGSVLFFHRRVRLGRRLGFLPPLHLVAVDEGGEVDTIEFNRCSPVSTRAEHRQHVALLGQALAAFERADLRALGQIATRSALVHQERNPKRLLPLTLEVAEETNALGVVVTHSGPCIGLLFRSSARQSVEYATDLLKNRGHEVMQFRTATRRDTQLPWTANRYLATQWTP